ncbi:uncharacterized protein LOC129301080 [Prosopis cineraria]|uniref:uncharacterized protein LOC129301080 n=1 Tax=Prosopis cineraria TaxID=364024 RepID=UPI00240F2B8B|nr:uncharacterized protein LOC129301080 [Prosopis cineraria]
MASTSAKEVFCYLYVDGHFVKDLQGKMTYEGGRLISKLIREGINLEELLRMVSSVTGVESGASELKFTVKFSEDTYIDLLDDEGVQHLIKYNDESAHVHVETNDNEINGAMDNSMEMENLLTWLLPGSPCRQELESISPSLSCSTQNALAPLPEVNSLCEKLKETDPDTVAKWVASTNYRFDRLFIAYGYCIKGFLQGAHPILFIDGSHLSGPYKGTLLAASAIDANNDLFPLANAIVGGETYDNWAWFLENVREITHQVQLTIMSDRHNAIVGAIRAIFDGNRHAFCYRHVKENYSSKFTKINRGMRRIDGITKEDALKLLDNIAYARLETEFHVAMHHLMVFSPQLARWLETNGDINLWALARFPYKRWDNITSNHAESFNAWLVKERKHHICALINEHRAKLARKLYNSKIEMVNWSNGVGPRVEAKWRENVLRAEVMVAEHYSVNMILVKVGNNDLRLNLTLQECSCQEWQMVGIPCAHACAAIKLVQGNMYSYVEECYTIRAQEKIYSSTMIPVETIDMPQLTELHYEDYEKNTFLEPLLTTRPLGRPPTKRRESQFQNKKVYHCSRCNQAGHTKNRCRNPNPI